MRSFLSSEEGVKQACEATEKADLLLKGVVKRFFNEKEVTSTLVMDALYCGCRALDVGDMKHQDASKLTAKPNRAVWLSVSQNKVHVFFFCSTDLRCSSRLLFCSPNPKCAVRLIAFFVLMRRY